MIDLSTAGSRIALYVDAAFTYNLRLQYGKEKIEVLFTQKLCTKKKKKILESMQHLPATVSSSASTEESLPVRREIGDILIHSMTHQRHENFYTPVAVRGGSATPKVLAIKRPLPAKRGLHATNDIHCWVSNPCIKYLCPHQPE